MTTAFTTVDAWRRHFRYWSQGWWGSPNFLKLVIWLCIKNLVESVRTLWPAAAVSHMSYLLPLLYQERYWAMHQSVYGTLGGTRDCGQWIPSLSGRLFGVLTVGWVGQTGWNESWEMVWRSRETWKMKPIPENPQWGWSLLNAELHLSVCVCAVYPAITALLLPEGCLSQFMCPPCAFANSIQLLCSWKGSWWFGNVHW